MGNSETIAMRAIVDAAFEKDKTRQAKAAEEIRVHASRPIAEDPFLKALREAHENDN